MSRPNQGFGWATVNAVGCTRVRTAGRMTHIDGLREPDFYADNEVRRTGYSALFSMVWYWRTGRWRRT